jgi:hypothetical protein
MMAPEVYERARADAPLHIQVWRARTQSSPPSVDVVRINGRVVRIFRNHGGVLRWGQKITFTVPIIGPNRGPPMPSGNIRHAWERIGPSRYLEAFLEAWDGELHLVRSQVAPIRRPSLRPVCGPSVKGFVCPGNL